MPRSVDPRNLGSRLVPESSAFDASEVSTTVRLVRSVLMGSFAAPD